MKRLSFFVAVATVLVLSCKDEEIKPVPTNDEQSSFSDDREAAGARSRCMASMDVRSYHDSARFSVSFEGTGTVTIDWGDGTPTETHTLPGDDVYFEIEHVYADGSLSHTATLTGDLSKIKTFNSHDYESGITDLYGMACMSGLQDFYPSLGYDGVLDLKKNKQLESLNLWFVHLPNGLQLPNRHYINFLGLQLVQEHPLTQVHADEIISNLYSNAVARNIRNGYLEISNTAVPSNASFDKMRALRDQYGWYVFVDDLQF